MGLIRDLFAPHQFAFKNAAVDIRVKGIRRFFQAWVCHKKDCVSTQSRSFDVVAPFLTMLQTMESSLKKGRVGPQNPTLFAIIACCMVSDSHKEQVKKLKRRLWQDKDIAAFSSLGSEAVVYLEALCRARQPIKKNVVKLLSLKDDYGAVSVIYAIKKALIHNAIGADYIENILYQEMTPKKHHPPVRLKKEALNRIRLPEPCLVEYDAHAIKRSKK